MTATKIMEIGCQFDPNQHELISHNAYVSSMRLSTGVKDLTLYRHRLTGNFMLFVWWTNSIMCEIWNCGKKPPGITEDNTPTREDLLRVLRPTAEIYEKMRRHNDEAEKALMNERARELADRNSKVAYLKRHGETEEAVGIDTGRIPWAPASEELTDYFKTLSRGASIIVP